ncbi:MAG TPA: hypothetical protein VM842_07745 [Nitrospira sp.]|nr:hypothetical protein [Nitrospira sp.]
MRCQTPHMLAQSFFFSTYATLLNAKGEAKNMLFAHQQEFLLWAVPIVALMAGLMASISIFCSVYTIENLGRNYGDYRHQREDNDRTTKLFPPIQGPEAIRKWARVAPIGLPLLFILTWLVILLRLIVSAS